MPPSRFAPVMCLAAALAAADASALERHELRADTSSEVSDWDAGASCVVTYANACTGWIWAWDFRDDDETMGTVLEPCCEGGRLVSTSVYFWDGAIAGWGYTGTLAVSPVVGPDCPGVPYQSIPFLPPERTITMHDWNVPPGPVVLTYTSGPNVPEVWHYTNVITDHPAAGPTGPPACGNCFPSTRVTHAFHYGTDSQPLCPGDRLNDGVCDAELLHWVGNFSCTVPVRAGSWGTLKSLYR